MTLMPAEVAQEWKSTVTSKNNRPVFVWDVTPRAVRLMDEFLSDPKNRLDLWLARVRPSFSTTA
jgi:hypothetical protein